MDEIVWIMEGRALSEILDYLFWRTFFDGPWYQINERTINYNVLGMKEWMVRIEEWWNYETHETKIITHTRRMDGTWETQVSSKSKQIGR